jgi:hypothetical protein
LCEHDNEFPSSIKARNFLIRQWITGFSRTLLNEVLLEGRGREAGKSTLDIVSLKPEIPTPPDNFNKI